MELEDGIRLILQINQISYLKHIDIFVQIRNYYFVFISDISTLMLD